MGLGTDNAEQFFFALDPRHVLILVLPANLTEAVFPLGDWFVGLINRVIVAFSYKYVYQHPEHRLISGLIRKEPRDIAPKDQMEALMQPYVEAALQDLDAQRQPSKGEI
jgi:hypothetical protein